MKTDSIKSLIRCGDAFRIRSRRMSASGEVVRVNRKTFDWRSDYMGHPVAGRLALFELSGATIFRHSEGSAFSILPQR